MASFSQKFNPRANVFILVNLGCEMLYVIDQRLKAQQIAVDKSVQVIHDVTAVLLEPKFLDSLIVGSTQANAQLLTAEHCKFMLKDIATCSLMRLDDTSMDKLWNLMTMIYKWQLSHSRYRHHLMDITFRHLDSIGKLYPDERRSLLLDFTKNTLLDFWNSFSDDEQHSIYCTNMAWLQIFETKISLLIRLGFQALDGSFVKDCEQSYYQEFVDGVGENIYAKSAEIAARRREELTASSFNSSRCVNQLAEMLNCGQAANLDFKPIDAADFQKRFENNLQECNILFQDLDVNGIKQAADSSSESCGFVQLNASQLASSVSPRTDAARAKGLNKELLDLYSKMD